MEDPLRMLVACEFSGTVRDQFSLLGWEAWSCDFMPSETPGHHYEGNVLDILHYGWDLLIAHPPCTHLASSGARWFREKGHLQQEALAFVAVLMRAEIDYIAIENPVGVISTQIRKPDQIIQPYEFGHNEMKTTCLWLKNLPSLLPTHRTPGRDQRIIRLPGTAEDERSRTYIGIAQAMAHQWTDHIRRELEL